MLDGWVYLKMLTENQIDDFNDADFRITDYSIPSEHVHNMNPNYQ